MITYRPIVEELADLILSADVETVGTIHHRFGEQVKIRKEKSKKSNSHSIEHRYHLVNRRLHLKFVSPKPIHSKKVMILVDCFFFLNFN